MAKISRYIIKEFLLYFLTTLIALLVITTVFSALADIKLLEKENGVSLFVQAILSGIPLLLEIITPVSVLLATVLTFTTLSKSSEIVAMMAAGISVFRLILPVLSVGMVISLFIYINQSYLAPWWGADKRVSVVQSAPSDASWQFYRGRLYYFSGLAKRRQTVASTKIFEFSDNYELTTINDYIDLHRTGDNWLYTQGESLTLRKDEIRWNDLPIQSIHEDELPVIFKQELPHPKYSNFRALVREIEIKRQGAVNYEDDMFALFQKLSNMITIFVMILLALPFSLFSSRSANVSTGIVVSVVIGFSFWLADQIFVSLNGTGALPGVILAFAANAIFFMVFLALIKARRV